MTRFRQLQLSACVALAAVAFGANAAQATSEGAKGATAQLAQTAPCKPETLTPSQDSLSDKLDDCSGVLRPTQGMDPENIAPAPDPTPGTTPVIRPNLDEHDPK